MQVAGECAIVGTIRSHIAARSRRAATRNLNLLVYPETVKMARLITNLGFNDRMLSLDRSRCEIHTLIVHEIGCLLPPAEDSEQWRADIGLPPCSTRPTREIAKHRPNAHTTSNAAAPPDRGWAIWGV
jgi:hypothetical protein